MFIKRFAVPESAVTRYPPFFVYFLLFMDFESNSFLFRVVTIGETNVGKTSIIDRLINSRFSESETPTIGGNFLMHVETIQNQKVELQIWDTAGQEKYRALSPIYCRDAAVGLIVFDLTNKESFTKLDNWIELFKEAADKEALLYIVGNKCDLSSRFEVEPSVLDDYTDKGYHCFLTSAKTGQGVHDLFHDICVQLHASSLKIRNEGFVHLPSPQKPKQESGCC